MTATLYNWLAGFGFLLLLLMLALILKATRKPKTQGDRELQSSSDSPLGDLLDYLHADEARREWEKLTLEQRTLLARIYVTGGLSWHQIDDAYWQRLPDYGDPTLSDYLLERSTLLERKSKGDANLARYIASKKSGKQDLALGVRTWKVKAEFKPALEKPIQEEIAKAKDGLSGKSPSPP